MVCVALAESLPGVVAAKDVKGLWYIGGSFAYQTIEDEIGNNAAMAGDPRPDNFISREIAVDDSLRFDLTVGFGLSKWISLQLDVGYFKGDVGPIEVFLDDTFPAATNPLDPSILNAFVSRQEVIPTTAAQLIQVPVSLSGVVRFRVDRPLNPYVGAGAGIIFTEARLSPDVDSLNGRLSSLRITGVVDEHQIQITPQEFQHLRGEGRVPFTFPLAVDVDDATEFHVLAGMEYFFNRNLSLVAEARYTVSNRHFTITAGGEDQVSLLIFSEELFRSDGSLKIFNDARLPPNPLVDPADPIQGRVLCQANTTGDFDNDGRIGDLCYHNDVASRSDDPDGVFLVQGGEIDLSGFSVHLGMRWSF